MPSYHGHHRPTSTRRSVIRVMFTVSFLRQVGFYMLALIGDAKLLIQIFKINSAFRATKNSFVCTEKKIDFLIDHKGTNLQSA